MEDDEVERLLRIFDKSYFSEHRDSTIILLLLDLGMRIGECLKISTDDLDMNERTVYLPAENTKGRKGRYVFFSLRLPERYNAGSISETAMIVERMQTGRAIARQDPNFREGRPKKFTPEQIGLALPLLAQGKTYRQVTTMTGISKSTLIRAKSMR